MTNTNQGVEQRYEKAGGREAEAYREDRQRELDGCFFKGTANKLCGKCLDCRDHYE